jgi:molybdenum cofactor cytidylyltransferase
LTAGALILAAGAATRMGRAKQLLEFEGRTLLEHAIQQASLAGFEPLIVVLGAHAAEIRPALAGQIVEVVLNEKWESGMGSSLTLGLARVREIAPRLPALAVLLADQPRIRTDHLQGMRRLFEKQACACVAAEYSGTLGAPAIFRESQFAALAALPPESGAGQLLRSSDVPVCRYPLPEAAIDVDTPEDYAALNRANDL